MIDSDKVDDILEADDAVRYVGIIDLTGNIVASKSRRARGGGKHHASESLALAFLDGNNVKDRLSESLLARESIKEDYSIVTLAEKPYLADDMPKFSKTVILKESVGMADPTETGKELSLRESVAISNFVESSHAKLLSSPIGDVEP